MEEIRLDLADLKFKPPEEVREVVSQQSEKLNLYPSGDYSALKEKFSDYTGAEKEQITFSNGLDEMIDLCTRVWGGKNVIPVPTFSQFEEAAKREGHEVIARDMVQGKKYVYSLEEDDLESDLIWVCNPNNPTGTEISREKIESVLQRTEAMVVVDECYSEFMGETVVDLVEEYSNLVVLRSFSKNFGLAGLRLGSAISQKENIEKLDEIRQPFNVNRIAEKAGEAALENRGKYKDIWSKVLNIGEEFAERMDNLDVETAEINANFVLCEFNSREEAEKVYKALEEENIITFPGWHEEFSGLPDRFIRFTIGKRSDMEKASKVVENAL